MTLGTGLFLGSLIFCLTILFLFTKDRWNWKKIVGWAIAIPLAVITVFVLYMQYEEMKWLEKNTSPIEAQQTGNQAKKINKDDTFLGFKLGTSREDILFFKGKPKNEVTSNALEYDYAGNDLVIGIRNNKVSYIYFYGDVSAINNLGFDFSQSQKTDSIDWVVGANSEVLKSSDKLARLFLYKELDFFITFEKDKITGVGRFDSRDPDWNKDDSGWEPVTSGAEGAHDPGQYSGANSK